MASLNAARQPESTTESSLGYNERPLRNTTGTVLLVDDEPFILRVLARALEHSAYNVVRCNKPSEALQLVLHHDVVLIVSDMTMPEMSGLGLLRVIRNLDSDLPVVLMTGRSDPESIVEALECGASEYLIKPFDISKFRQTVQRLARPPRTSAQRGPASISAGG